MGRLPDADAGDHPGVAERQLDRERQARGAAMPAQPVGDGEAGDGIERERRDDVGREAGERDRPAPEPAQAQQRLALARARPAELLAPERPPLRRRVGLDQRGRLVDGPPARAQQLVGEHAVVADVLRHAEHGLADERLDRGLERHAAVGDRPAGEAADLAEHRLRGDRQVVADVLHPVREPADRVGVRVEDGLAGRDAADARIGERAEHLLQRVGRPDGVRVEHDHDVGRRVARAQPGVDRGALARLRDAQHAVAVLRGDRGERGVAAVDHRDQLGRARSRRRWRAPGGRAPRARCRRAR